MITLEEFNQNIWKFFNSKKTLEEALEAFGDLSIESKSVMAMLAFKMADMKPTIGKKGEEQLELTIGVEELKHFASLCKQKEQEGWFNSLDMDGAFDNFLKTEEEDK